MVRYLPGRDPPLRQGLLHRHDPRGHRPAAARRTSRSTELAAEISPEKIDEADADWIFTGVYGDAKATKRDATQANPLWKNLRAVKAGRAKNVPDETWYLGLGVTAADRVLDDLRATGPREVTLHDRP